MHINGKIEAIKIDKYGNKKVIAKGHNTFTNIGRQHVCDWLLHDNYSDDLEWNGINPMTGGRSLSATKIIPYTDVTVHRIGTHSYVENPEYSLYPWNFDTGHYTRLCDANGTWDEGSYNPIYGTLYWEFKEPKNIKNIVIWGYREGWNTGPAVDISTSPDDFATNSNWTRQNTKFVNMDANGADDDMDFWSFDYAEHPNRNLENVKTLRWRQRCDRGDYWNRLWGIWFLEANDYPNTPSVISLGINDTTPDATDTTLGSEAIRKFVRFHKETGNDTQVKYSIRLDTTEGNGINFKEIGLQFHPKAGDYLGGDHLESHCTSLFARGLFDTPWSKSEGDIVDIDYTLTISN